MVTKASNYRYYHCRTNVLVLSRGLGKFKLKKWGTTPLTPLSFSLSQNSFVHSTHKNCSGTYRPRHSGSYQQGGSGILVGVGSGVIVAVGWGVNVAIGCFVAVAMAVGAGAGVHKLRKTINAAAIRILFIHVPLE